MSQQIDYKSLSLEMLEQLAETDSDAVWEIVRREQEELDRLEWEEEDFQLHLDLADCLNDQFDETDMLFADFEDDEPTQVWFTEPPGGHNGWE